ncbi:MAG: O-antigen ligase family protein [Armatimonadota bacterium]
MSLGDAVVAVVLLLIIINICGTGRLTVYRIMKPYMVFIIYLLVLTIIQAVFPLSFLSLYGSPKEAFLQCAKLVIGVVWCMAIVFLLEGLIIQKVVLFLTVSILTSTAIATYTIYESFVVGVLRPSATFENPNLLGEYLFLNVAMCFIIARLSPRRNIFSFLPIPLLFGGILGTASRSALLAAMLIIILSAVDWRNTRKVFSAVLKIALSAISVGYLLYTSNAYVITRLTRTENVDNGRFELWKTALKAISEYTLTGIGLAQFTHFLKSRMSDVLQMPHNIYLTYFAETGVVGGVLFIAVFASVLKAAWNFYRQNKQLYAQTVFILFISFALQGCFGNFDSHRSFWVAFGLLIAMKSRYSITNNAS